VNPYNDPRYPELEFVNYDDPNYEVDQGITDEKLIPVSVSTTEMDGTEEEIEAMREDRRRRNDEFQFETYHADVLKSGEAYKGEWTVYRTSTFLDGDTDDDDDGDAPPQLQRERVNRKVVSVGKKIVLPETEGGFEFRVDGERIVNEERSASANDFEDGEAQLDDIDTGGGDSYSLDTVGRPFWPEEMKARDFRGDAGIMCVGNGYTICDAVPLSVGEAVAREEFDGPFAKLRTEVGIHYKRMRFRIKLDYSIKGLGPNFSDTDAATTAYDGIVPALHLCSMVVCRETWERWPRYQKKNVDESDSDRLFGPSGAPGGLYDPPPVGSEEQSKQYMLLDLEGGATALFPYKIDQDPEAHSGNGWVTSLDWTPGRIRFQVDRKVMGGVKLRRLRTLELSEVEGKEAEQWRPRDGGADMRR